MLKTLTAAMLVAAGWLMIDVSVPDLTGSAAEAHGNRCGFSMCRPRHVTVGSAHRNLRYHGFSGLRRSNYSGIRRR